MYFPPIHLFVDVLDGAMITIATYTLNFLHPGYLLAEVLAAERRKKTDPTEMEKEHIPLVNSEIWTESDLKADGLATPRSA